MFQPIAFTMFADLLAHTGKLTARVSTMDVLMERTTELRTAQAFLTRVDTTSEVELEGMVDTLNALSVPPPELLRPKRPGARGAHWRNQLGADLQ